MNRDKAADVGAEVETIGRTLETMLGGRQVTRFKQNGKQYDVIVQVADVERTNPDDLAKIYVRGADGADDPALQPGRACANRWRRASSAA